MVKPTIQHYIPRWYLQYFSNDYNRARRDGHIWAYKKKTRKIQQNLISVSAQKTSFYDESGTFETYLNPIEARTAKTVGTVVRNQNIQGFSQASIDSILEFILLQSQRTEASKNFVKRFIDGHTEEKFPQLKKITNSPEYYELAFQHHIKATLALIEILSDLKMFLLFNSTSIPFITSDYPVVMNNYFYPNIGVHGFITPGLQMFLPISDKLCLFLVHQELYQISTRNNSEIEITQEKDIDSLNYLQVLNSYKYLFSKDDETKIIKKSSKSTKHLKEQFERDYGQSRMKRGYDNLHDRNYSIPVSFLNAKIRPNLSQFDNYPNNPKRNKVLYERGVASHEHEMKDFKRDLRALLERENT